MRWIASRLKGVMEIDELCNAMENLIPLHDTQEEFRILQISRSMSIENLSSEHFLQESFHRYRRYLKYINFYKFVDGKLIHILLREFLQYEKGTCNMIFLAAKCVVIDTMISNLIEKDFYQSESEDEDEDEFESW